MRETLKTAQFTSVNALIHEFLIFLYQHIGTSFLYFYLVIFAV